MQPSKKANVLLWTAQVLLALVFLFAGGLKLAMPLAALAKVAPLPAWFLKCIGAAEATGAIGLILPWALRIRPELTPIAAAGLVIIMAGATVVSLAIGPVAPALVPAVVGILAAFVAHGRWRQAPSRRPAQRFALQPVRVGL